MNEDIMKRIPEKNSDNAKFFRLRDFIKVIERPDCVSNFIELYEAGFGLVGIMPSDSPALNGYLDMIVIEIGNGFKYNTIETDRGCFYVDVMEVM